MQLFLAAIGEFEGIVEDATDLLLVVLQGLLDVAQPPLVDAGLLVAEIQATHQFPHHHHIDAVADDLGLQRREMGDFPGQGYRAEIGIGVVAPAHGQQGAALGLLVHRDLLGSLVAQADGPLDDRIRRVAHRDRGFRKRAAVIEPGLAAEGGLVEIEGDIVIALVDQFQNLDGFPHDFRADAVAGQNGDLVMLHGVLVPRVGAGQAAARRRLKRRILAKRPTANNSARIPLRLHREGRRQRECARGESMPGLERGPPGGASRIPRDTMAPSRAGPPARLRFRTHHP